MEGQKALRISLSSRVYVLFELFSVESSFTHEVISVQYLFVWAVFVSNKSDRLLFSDCGFEIY